MKKTLCVYLGAHLTLCALGGMLSVAMYLITPGAFWEAVPQAWWTLTLPVMAVFAVLLGRALGNARLARNNCWNAATYLYAASLVLLALVWKFPTLPAMLINVWNLPCAAPLAGLDAWIGALPVKNSGAFFPLLGMTVRYQTLILPIMGALVAAVEPLCFSLGILSAAPKPAAPRAPIPTCAPEGCASCAGCAGCHGETLNSTPEKEEH